MQLDNLDQKSLDAIKSIPGHLVKPVLEFNFSPAGYTHPDHLNDKGSGPGEKLAGFLLGSPRVQQRLSMAIIKTKGLENHNHLQFKNPLETLALVTCQDQQQIARIAILLSNNASARKLIDGKSVARIVQLVSRDGLEFALQRPDDEKGSQQRLDVEDLLKHIETGSTSMLAGWLDQLPMPMAERVRLKYPMAHFDNIKKSASALGALQIAAEKFVPICLNKKN